jgi:hypothetical protein
MRVGHRGGRGFVTRRCEPRAALQVSVRQPEGGQRPGAAAPHRARYQATQEGRAQWLIQSLKPTARSRCSTPSRARAAIADAICSHI